jgi:hypothetical protein
VDLASPRFPLVLGPNIGERPVFNTKTQLSAGARQNGEMEDEHDKLKAENT